MTQPETTHTITFAVFYWLQEVGIIEGHLRPCLSQPSSPLPEAHKGHSPSITSFSHFGWLHKGRERGVTQNHVSVPWCLAGPRLRSVRGGWPDLYPSPTPSRCSAVWLCPIGLALTTSYSQGPSASRVFPKGTSTSRATHPSIYLLCVVQGDMFLASV